MSDNRSFLLTLRDYVRWGATRFRAAGLCFGHGMDNALDEALALVLHALHLDHSLPAEYLDARLTESEKNEIEVLFDCRIQQRLPVAYLVGEINFCGLPFYVDERVLIPRSPIAEYIETGFHPWLQADAVEQVLDLCTGSGCIGIACAYAFPHAEVDLADVSTDALAVARRNIDRHELGSRVRAVESNLFDALQGHRYDLIVSNPPYVSRDEYAQLPAEFGHEPKLGLEAGEDGLDLVAHMLAQGADHLKPGGIMVVEVGSSAQFLLRRYPQVPFLWLDFERGGDGVFLLTAEQLAEYRDIFSESLES